MGFKAKSWTYARKRLSLKARSSYQQVKPKPGVESKSASDLAPRNIDLRGAGLAIQDCEDPEVLLEGPAGTGKTVAALAKVYEYADRNPGAHILILRQVKASLAESVLKTFERDILPENHPEQGRVKRKNRTVYYHINGSEIVCGGLDKPDKILSTEWDLIYFAEALEANQDGYETLLGRLRGKAGPYQQIIADCNPGHPMHFLNLRAGRPGKPGFMTRFKSKHADNPYFHDGQDFNEIGKSYIAKLERMIGARRKRFLYGEWAASEGIIYGEAVGETHWVPKFQIPFDWQRIWIIDFGYANPFVWHEWAIDDDGRMYRVQEIYHTGLLVEDAAAMMLSATKESPRPSAIICDHDAEGRATLERHLGMMTTPAFKDVTIGIDAVKSRLKIDATGKPRILFLEDALIHEPDEILLEKKYPTCTDEEFALYQWNEKSLTKDQPKKEHDHGMDTMRYGVVFVDKVEKGGGVQKFSVPKGVRRR